MNRILRFTARELIPGPRDVLRAQGVPPGAEVTERVVTLAEEAVAVFLETADPRGLVRAITRKEWVGVFEGEGRNAPDPVVGDVGREADDLALFATTVGDSVSRSIDRLFGARRFAAAAMLDTAASLATDRAAELCAHRFRHELEVHGRATVEHHVLAYSPGYCGWHVTGQRALFTFVRPERIGITLEASCLMTPVKSVSGVLASGTADVHVFTPGYPYCEACRDRSCLVRMEALRRREPTHRTQEEG